MTKAVTKAAAKRMDAAAKVLAGQLKRRPRRSGLVGEVASLAGEVRSLREAVYEDVSELRAAVAAIKPKAQTWTATAGGKPLVVNAEASTAPSKGDAGKTDGESTPPAEKTLIHAEVLSSAELNERTNSWAFGFRIRMDNPVVRGVFYIPESKDGVQCPFALAVSVDGYEQNGPRLLHCYALWADELPPNMQTRGVLQTEYANSGFRNMARWGLSVVIDEHGYSQNVRVAGAEMSVRMKYGGDASEPRTATVTLRST